MLRRQDVDSFDRYPFKLPAVRDLHALPLHPHVTFLVGENGSGKSTLIEALAVASGFGPGGGSAKARVWAESHSSLHEALVLERARIGPLNGFFLRAESFY